MADAQESSSYRNLLKVIWETKPKPLTIRSASAPSPNCHYIRPRIDCDEVFPGIYIGDENAARNKEYLKTEGITHVLNTAQGNRIAQVNTNQEYYRFAEIKFLGLKLLDTPETKISVHFDECADFIENCLNNKGKVLVHCYMGISRSATIVLAYLMLRKGMSAETAIRTVREQRDISPNNGFLQQLCDLDGQLRSSRRSSL